MEYLCPPVYKYLALLLILYMFMSNYKSISNDKFLPIALIFVIIFMIFDFVLIEDHPNILLEKKQPVDELLEENDKGGDDSFDEEDAALNTDDY